MDVLDKGLLDFWQVLNNNHVAYIMIGGFAVNMQGFARATENADIWLKDDIENRKNLRRAFKEMNYGDFEIIETIDFVPGSTQFYMANGLSLDIIALMKGLENYSFDECMQRAKIVTLNAIKVPFLHINATIL